MNYFFYNIDKKQNNEKPAFFHWLKRTFSLRTPVADLCSHHWSKSKNIKHEKAFHPISKKKKKEVLKKDSEARCL